MMSVWDLLRIFAKRKPRFKYAYSVDVRYLSGICSVLDRTSGEYIANK